MWRPYLKDRKMLDHPDGFVVIVPIDEEPTVPVGCSLCRYLFRSRDDESAYIEFGCCHRCAMAWAHARRAAWKEGWRPTDEQVKAEVAVRAPMTVVFDID